MKNRVIRYFVELKKTFITNYLLAAE